MDRTKQKRYFHLEYKLEQKELFRFMLYTFYSKWWVIGLNIGALFLIVMQVLALSGKMENFSTLDGVTYLTLLLLIGTIIYMPVRAYLAAKKMAKRDALKIMITQRGIKKRNEKSESERLWSDVHKVKELKHMYIIMLTNQIGTLIPKRVLVENMDNWESFVSWIKAGVPSKKAKIK